MDKKTILDLIPWATLLDPQFTLGWCSVIFLYFLGCAVWLWRRVVPMRRALRRATVALQTSDGEKGFTQEFETYDKQIKAEPRLAHVWSEFVESLVFPPPGEEEAPIHNTTDVAYFLNEGTVIQPAVHTRFFNSVPGQLTGLGILGTFVGLAAGIGVASGNLASADPDVVKTGLQELLHGASLAFLTSIAGIFSSLVFLLIERRAIAGLHGRLGEWIVGLERRLRYVTAEGIALDQLRFAEEQADQLKTFNSELIFSLQQTLEEKVAARLAPHLERMVEVVEGLRADRSTDSARVIEEMIDRFTATVTERTGTEFESMSTTVRELDETLTASVRALQETNQAVADRLGSMVTSIEGVLGTAAGTVQRELAGAMEAVKEGVTHSSHELSGQLTEAGGQVADTLRGAAEDAARKMTETSTEAAAAIAASLAGFDRGVAKLGETMSASRALLDNLGAYTNRVDGLTQRLDEVHQRIQAIADGVREATEEVKVASDRVTRAVEGSSGVVERVTQVAEQMGRNQEAVTSAWQDYRQRFEGIDHSLNTVFAQIDEGLGRYTEQVKSFATELDQKTAATVQHLAGATDELRQTLEDLDDILGRLPRG